MARGGYFEGNDYVPYNVPTHEEYKLWTNNGNGYWEEVASGWESGWFVYLGNNYQYDNNNHTFYVNNTYSWVEGSSASGLYFTYGNVVYQYIASSNSFKSMQETSGADKLDLMFIVRNTDKSTIITENNRKKLKLQVNYYKVD